MWLKVLTGRDTGKVVEVAGEELVVGRGRRCDIVLRDGQIASRHAVFRVVPGGTYALEDLGSSGGTFVAGRRIKDAVELEGNEQLCFGFTFAALSVTPPRRWRPALVLAGAAALGLAVVGATAALLAPRAGGDERVTPRLAAATIAVSATAEAVPPLPTVPAAPAPAETAVSQGNAAPPVERAVVFRDDFSDPQTGWEVFEESGVAARYEDGEFAVDIADPTYFATVDSGRSFARPIVKVTVRNPGRATSAGFGVLCHYRSPESFDVLAVSTNGTAAVLRRSAQGLAVIPGGAWARSRWIPVGAVRYALRAECADGALRLSVNGHRVVGARAKAEGGRIGLFAGGKGELRFDNVAVERSTPTAAGS